MSILRDHVYEVIDSLLDGAEDREAIVGMISDALEAELPDEQVVLITGNVVDGVQIIGPFDNGDDAGRYAENASEIDSHEWLSATLYKPGADR